MSCRVTLQCGWSVSAPYFEWQFSNVVQACLEGERKLKELGIKEGSLSCYYNSASQRLNHKINSFCLTIKPSSGTNADKKRIIKQRVKELAAWLRANALRHSSRYQASIRQGVCWMVGGTRKQNRVKFSRYTLARMALFTDSLLRGWREPLLEFLRKNLDHLLESVVQLLPRPPLEQHPQLQPNAPAAA